MTSEAFAKAIGKLRTNTQKKLNDIHIWSSLAISALKHSASDRAILNKSEFKVPSSKPGKTVPRDPVQVGEIIKSAIRSDFYSAVLVYVVAQVEAFLVDVIYQVLSFDNRRLKTGVSGLEGIKTVDVAFVVDSPSRDELIDRIIEKQIVALLYAKPAIQFDYIQRVLGVTIEQEKRVAWAELKATRDLIVHNSGEINDVYLQKCGHAARGNRGDAIPLDKAYFEQSIALSKALVGQVASQLQASLKPEMKV